MMAKGNQWKHEEANKMFPTTEKEPLATRKGNIKGKQNLLQLIIKRLRKLLRKLRK